MSSASNVVDPLRAGPASSTALVRTLQMSQPTLSRALTSLQREGRVLKLGATRGTRYALLRKVPGAGSSWPVFKVDAAGRIRELGRLHALEPRHCYFESEHLALRGLTEGLPSFLRDQRPAGFLGDALSAAHADLGLPSRASQWSDDNYLAWCTSRGWDCAGDLIVGAGALEEYRKSLQQRQVVKSSERATKYPRLAAQALAQGQVTSQLPGEQPKFTVLVDHGGHLVQALVKFSPPLESPVGQRWGDLLMAEHVAHVHLNARGVGAAHSRMFRYDGRMFLEVDRFDRVGAEGRRGVISLQSATLARGGADDSWSRAALRLTIAGILPRNDARQVRLVESFARQIANTDLHPGNLSLFDRHDGTFALAPVYDMLPSLFAPQEGELVERSFEVPESTAETLDVWPQARRLAEGYWERLAVEQQLSAGFRQLCARALNTLRAAPQRGTQAE